MNKKDLLIRCAESLSRFIEDMKPIAKLASDTLEKRSQDESFREHDAANILMECRDKIERGEEISDEEKELAEVAMECLGTINWHNTCLRIALEMFNPDIFTDKERLLRSTQKLQDALTIMAGIQPPSMGDLKKMENQIRKKKPGKEGLQNPLKDE